MCVSGTYGSQKRTSDPMELRIASFVVYKSQESCQNFKIRHGSLEKIKTTVETYRYTDTLYKDRKRGLLRAFCLYDCSEL